MASHSSSFFPTCLFLFLIFGMVSAQLSTNFYATKCPKQFLLLKLQWSLQFLRRLAWERPCFVFIFTIALLMQVSHASHWCVQHIYYGPHNECVACPNEGCDASVLLDDTSSFTGEKTARQNVNSLRGFDVINTIKTKVEALCPGVVSCADIVTLAARDSVVALGGPSWTVPLGRRDSTTASLSTANSDIPGFNLSLSGLISSFSKKGFTVKEMVALSGSHTIGQARCTTFRTRIYNETNIDSTFSTSLRSKCPSTGGDNNLSPLDVTSATKFDNAYFKNLVSKKGLLHSDQELFNGGSTNSQVSAYSTNPGSFSTDFANGMVKMGKLSPLTGTSGQIRTNCGKTN